MIIGEWPQASKKCSRSAFAIAAVVTFGLFWVMQALIGVAGEPVAKLADFYRKAWALGKPGVKVPLMVMRGNEPKLVTVESISRYRWLKLKPSY